MSIQPSSRTIHMAPKKRQVARVPSEVNISSDLRVNGPTDGGKDQRYKNFAITQQDGSKLMLEMTNVLLPDDLRELGKGKKLMATIQVQNEDAITWHQELSTFMSQHFDEVLPSQAKVFNYIFKSDRLDARVPTNKGHEVKVIRRDGRPGSIKDLVGGTTADVMLRLDGFWCSVPSDESQAAKAGANWDVVSVRITQPTQAPEPQVEWCFRDELTKMDTTGSAAGGGASSSSSSSSSPAGAQSSTQRKGAKRARTEAAEDEDDEPADDE
jgi:hypothetical protein